MCGLIEKTYLVNPRYKTYVVKVLSVGRLNSVYWTDVSLPLYVIAETTGHTIKTAANYWEAFQLLEYITDYDYWGERRRQEKKYASVMGDEYELSAELDTEHLDWLLHEQEVEEIGWR